MIDFHCHILPALDDGAVSVDDSLSMAKALVDFGYTTVCCTPHCLKGYYDLTPKKVREATLMLQADLDNADIRLELQPGIEYMLDECFAEYADELLPIGDTKLILCEAPHQAHAKFVYEGLELIMKKGFVPLIAHPERTDFFYRVLVFKADVKQDEVNAHHIRPEPLPSLPRKYNFLKNLFSRKSPEPLSLNPGASNFQSGCLKNCLFQANFGSFTGFYGPQVQRRAYELLKLDVYSAIASDLHDSVSAGAVLYREKLDMNPFLKKLSEWDGSVEISFGTGAEGAGEQIGLF